MVSILERVQRLAASGKVRISDHGYDELSDDGILVSNVLAGLEDAVTVEEYPDYPKGPCVLVLCRDQERRPIHALWGIPTGRDFPAVLVTAYRPEPDLWDATFQRRRT